MRLGGLEITTPGSHLAAESAVKQSARRLTHRRWWRNVLAEATGNLPASGRRAVPREFRKPFPKIGAEEPWSFCPRLSTVRRQFATSPIGTGGQMAKCHV